MKKRSNIFVSLLVLVSFLFLGVVDSQPQTNSNDFPLAGARAELSAQNTILATVSFSESLINNNQEVTLYYFVNCADGSFSSGSYSQVTLQTEIIEHIVPTLASLTHELHKIPPDMAECVLQVRANDGDSIWSKILSIDD